MESTSAFTRGADPGPHPCITTSVARGLALLPSIQKTVEFFD
jgi:hypothetical protein